MSNAKDEIRGVIVACLSGIMAGTAHTEEPKAPFQVKTRKADDHVTARIQGDRAVLAVTPRSGIGGATIARQGERWQRAMIIRLQLRAMERLQVGNGRAMLT